MPAPYITIEQGFQLNAALPIDNRLLLNKSQMLTYSDPSSAEYATMPSKYFVICNQKNDPDEGKLFLYNKSATPDPEYGLFREVNAELSGDIDDLKNQVAALNDELADKLDKDDIKAGEGIEVSQDSEGNIILKSVINEHKESKFC